jgi:hypothetical protein
MKQPLAHAAPQNAAERHADEQAYGHRSQPNRADVNAIWREELLAAVAEAYGEQLAGLSAQAVARALDRALEASLFAGIRTGNTAPVRSLRRRFEAEVDALRGPGEIPAARSAAAASPAAATVCPNRRRLGRGQKRP